MKNEVLLYALNCAPLNDPALFGAYYALQPQARREKTDAYRRTQDKVLSIGAGILLSRVLPPGAAERVVCDENGKPYLPGEDIYFNLSHAGTWAICAVSGAPVGCDIEQLGAYRYGVAQRFFHAEETRLLEAAADEESRRDLFFRLWTLKESYVKAVGRGIAMGLSSFCVSFADGAPALSGGGDAWRFMEYNVAEEYRCAVCAHADAVFAPQPVYVEL